MQRQRLCELGRLDLGPRISYRSHHAISGAEIPCSHLGKRAAPPSFYRAGTLLYSRRLFLIRWARSLKADSQLQQAVSTGICTHYKRRIAEKYLPGNQIFLHCLTQKSGKVFFRRRVLLALHFVPVFLCRRAFSSVMLSAGYCLKAVSPRGTINCEMILRCP